MEDSLIISLKDKIKETRKQLETCEVAVKANRGDEYAVSSEKEHIERYLKALEALERYIEVEKERQKERSVRYKEARRQMQISVNKIEMVKDRLITQAAVSDMFTQTLDVEQAYQDDEFDTATAANRIAQIDTAYGFDISYAVDYMPSYKQDFRVLLENLKSVYEVEDMTETTERLENFNSSFMFANPASQLVLEDAVVETSELANEVKAFETPDENLPHEHDVLANHLGYAFKESAKIGTEDYSPSVIANLEDQVNYLTKKQEEVNIEEKEQELMFKMETMAKDLEEKTDKIIVFELEEMIKKIEVQMIRLEDLAAKMVDENMVRDYAKYIESQLEECEDMLRENKEMNAQHLLDKVLELKDRCYDCVAIYNNELENMTPSLRLKPGEDEE